MNEQNAGKRREWVKNVAIIFLVILLILTFFSNTIMNYSLPEVATQYVQRGSITAKVRGTGNVEATDPYNVMVKESRVIASVAVKQGDQVEKDQILYYLEDAESEELAKAEEELEDLKLNYMKGLFGSNVSPEVISKVANGNVDGFSALQAKVTDMQNRLDNAEARVKECQENLDKLSLQSTISSNNSSVSTISDELEKAQASTDLTNATNGFNNYKAARVAELTAEIEELRKQIEDLEALISKGNGEIEVDPENPSDLPVTETTVDLQGKRIEAEKNLNAALNELNKAMGGNYSVSEALALSYSNLNNEQQLALEALHAAYADYKNYVESVDAVSNVGVNQNSLDSKKSRLNSLEAKLAEINAITVESSEGVQDATKRLQEAEKNITELTYADKQTSVAYQNQIANAEAALKTAQSVYDLLKEEQTNMNADINAELDLAKASKDIAKKQEEIEKLREKSMGAEIKAPVAGTVTSLAYVAGETTKPEDAAAVIQVEGKGYTLSISVTNDQANKVKVGDEAELQNSWYYDDVKILLASIKPDPDAPGQKKLLTFDVSGDSLTPGQALNISVGQRNAEYELVVPNSAVREDNNGKFILTVESKSSPLGNRYIATRVDVDVLASDDNNTAISAPLYGYEYVITTSTKPVEAGKQVRLNE